MRIEQSPNEKKKLMHYDSELTETHHHQTGKMKEKRRT